MEPGETWPSYLLYEASSLALTAGLLLGFSLRTEGAKHVPACGPALFVANHQSFLDPVLVALATRRHLCYLARKSLFRIPAFAWLIRALKAVPVDQEGIGIEGLRTISARLQEGRAVVVFPEGHRSADGALQPLKPGVCLLLKKLQGPVIPVGIAGAYEAWPRRSPLPVPAPLFLPPSERTLAAAIGPPLDGRALAERPREEALAVLAGELQRMRARAERLRWK